MKVKFIDSIIVEEDRLKQINIQNHSGDSNCCMMVPAALSSLALFHHKDVFITLPVSLLYSLVYQLAPSSIMTFILAIISKWKWSSTLTYAHVL